MGSSCFRRNHSKHTTRSLYANHQIRCDSSAIRKRLQPSDNDRCRLSRRRFGHVPKRLRWSSFGPKQEPTRSSRASWHCLVGIWMWWYWPLHKSFYLFPMDYRPKQGIPKKHRKSQPIASLLLNLFHFNCYYSI